MEKVIILQGPDLREFKAALGANINDVYEVRIWANPDGSGIKVSVNRRMWTTQMGEVYK